MKDVISDLAYALSCRNKVGRRGVEKVLFVCVVLGEKLAVAPRNRGAGYWNSCK